MILVVRVVVVALLRGGGGENVWYGVYGVDGEGGGVDVN